jgi:hypothetical protein
MAIRIKYIADCDCGGTMSMNELDLTQSGSDVVINLDMLGDFTIQCGTCFDEAFVPNISDLIQDVER